LQIGISLQIGIRIAAQTRKTTPLRIARNDRFDSGLIRGADAAKGSHPPTALASKRYNAFHQRSNSIGYQQPQNNRSAIKTTVLNHYGHFLT